MMKLASGSPGTTRISSGRATGHVDQVARRETRIEPQPLLRPYAAVAAGTAQLTVKTLS